MLNHCYFRERSAAFIIIESQQKPGVLRNVLFCWFLLSPVKIYMRFYTSLVSVLLLQSMWDLNVLASFKNSHFKYSVLSIIVRNDAKYKYTRFKKKKSFFLTVYNLSTFSSITRWATAECLLLFFFSSKRENRYKTRKKKQV